MKEEFYKADRSESYEQVMKKLKKSEQKYILVTADKRKLMGYVNLKRLKENQESNWVKHIKMTPVIEEDASLKDVLNKMIENDVTLIPIVDSDYNLKATITMEIIQNYISDEYNQEE